MANNKKCDSTTGNILPVDLDMANMINSSEQLTKLTYDFSPCKTYNLKIKCPSWMNTKWDNGGCTTGAIKIEQAQDNTEVDLLNFTSVGKLTGSGTDNHILCYYFPISLNRYNGADPDGGELVIELIEKSSKNKDQKTRLLLFIPVKRETATNEKNKSNKWFNGIYPRTQLSGGSSHSHTSSNNISLNDIIPKSAFWVYNDIKFHGEEPCALGSSPKEYKNTHAIFFMDEPAIISEDLFIAFNQISVFPGTARNPNDVLNYVDLSNNTDTDWLDAWYPMTSQIESGEMAGDSAGDSAGQGDAIESSTEPTKSEPVRRMRDFKNNKVNRGSIFRNELGTTMGPGLHNQAGDPFSLTCEPIVDENDKPIEGKDRLEWVKGIYNSVPKGMAQMFWALVFIVVLTGILMALHVFIFKNIGMFITQNEIANRVDK